MKNLTIRQKAIINDYIYTIKTTVWKIMQILGALGGILYLINNL